MREWFVPAELVNLPGLPSTPQNIRIRAERVGWECRKREAGKGMEYALRSLPKPAQAALLKRELQQNSLPAQGLASATTVESSSSLKPRGVAASYSYDPESLWAAFDRKSQKQKDKGRKVADFFQLVMRLTAGEDGMNFVEALELVASQHDVAPGTARNWWYGAAGKPGLVHFHPSDWMAAAAPGYVGRTATAEMSTEAWEFFKADYLRMEKPASFAVYRRLRRAAEAHKWEIPAEITFRRRIEREIPMTIRVLLREGEHALMRMYPAQQRTVKGMYALQHINGDGYQHNVFVEWPDGTIARPKTWFWQDIYSRMYLSYRVDRSEHTDQIILSFGDLVEKYGIPTAATIDNTRAVANKFVTGGVSNRYRFKVKADDPVGILPSLGVEIHWTSIHEGRGHGQAKPVERSFGVGGMGEYIDRHLAFAGAYTGNTTSSKPENYGSKAIPLATFLRVLEQEVIAWNLEKNRRTEMAGGVKSYQQVFEESYATATIRKATAEQRRLYLMSAEGVRVAPDGSIQLDAGAGAGVGKNRYHTDALYQHIGQKVLARFDPERLHDKLYVYTLDNKFIGEAPCIAAVGFNDTSAAREHAQARKHMIKGNKTAAKAMQKMSALEAAARLPTVEHPSAPESKVVSGVFASKAKVANGDVDVDAVADEAFSIAMARLRKEKRSSL